MSRSLAERFWEKVAKAGPDECWPWLGAMRSNGYGTLWDGERTRSSAQVAWELEHGEPFPEGKDSCHTCDNPPCSNPKHVWAGSRQENVEDMIQKGRQDNGRSSRTHCPKGHSYSGANLIVDRRGQRMCRTCRNDRNRIYMESYRQRAEV